VIVDNKGGAGGIIGIDFVVKAPPDGYTLLSVANTVVILPGMYKTLPFDPIKDLAPVTLLSNDPGVVQVLPTSDITSVKALVTAAKAKPGAFNYGSAGVGTTTHLAGELFKVLSETDITHVPYTGGGPAQSALLGGQIQVYFGPLFAALSQIKAGKIKAIAVTSRKRSRALPDVPTVAEAGVPNYAQETWNGVLAPARTPQVVIDYLYKEINAVLHTPALEKHFTSQGTNLGGITPAEYGAMLKEEAATWDKVIKAAGIQPQ